MPDRKKNLPSNAQGHDQETHFIDNRYSDSDDKNGVCVSKPQLSTTVMRRGDNEIANIVMPI
jgi:hypothetical protein